MLYIHIPFCDSKCGYCGFNSLTNMIDFKQQYINALRKDIDDSMQHIDSLDSIYIGGGTPNTLKPSDYYDIFDMLQPLITQDTEITIELNPNREIDTLKNFVELGVTRFSIGVQSFNEKKLRLLERNHNPHTARKFIEQAILCDIKTSIDIIYDTRLDTDELIAQEIKNANELGVGHISCYALSIDENSRFYEKGKNPTSKQSLCYQLKENLENVGFNQYEVSNYARNHKSKHNLSYWESKEYIGVGLSAVGKIGNNRIYKQNNIIEYINNPLKHTIEILTQEDLIVEKIFLGMRSEVGVHSKYITNVDKLNILLDNNQCTMIDNRIYSNNYFLADELAMWLI